MRLVDVNAWCDTLQGATAVIDRSRLARECEKWGVAECWCGSFDALLDADPVPLSLRAKEAASVPSDIDVRWFGTVNPVVLRPEALWLLKEAGFSGVRLYPPAHGYGLDAGVFWRLLELARRTGMLVQIVCRLEDPRTQMPPAKWPDVDLGPLDRRPLPCPVVLLNCSWRAVPQRPLENERVFVDTAMQEGLGPLDQAVQVLGSATRLLHGSYSPVFSMGAAVLKLVETELPEDAIEGIAGRNAVALLEGVQAEAD